VEEIQFALSSGVASSFHTFVAAIITSGIVMAAHWLPCRFTAVEIFQSERYGQSFGKPRVLKKPLSNIELLHN